jgi:hypothetical protein
MSCSDRFRSFEHDKRCRCCCASPSPPRAPDWIDASEMDFLDEDLNQSLPRTRYGDRYKIEFDQRAAILNAKENYFYWPTRQRIALSV